MGTRKASDLQSIAEGVQNVGGNTGGRGRGRSINIHNAGYAQIKRC